MRTLIVIAAAGLVLAACASSEKAAPEETATIVRTATPAVELVPQSALGPQTLQTGECGLFLWSKTDTSKFIFFSRATSGAARFVRANAPVDLIEARAGGDIFGQFNTEYVYAAPDNETVSVTLTPGDLLEAGQRIEAGLITVADAGGWSAKIPVLGVQACQTE